MEICDMEICDMAPGFYKDDANDCAVVFGEYRMWFIDAELGSSKFTGSLCVEDLEFTLPLELAL